MKETEEERKKARRREYYKNNKEKCDAHFTKWRQGKGREKYNASCRKTQKRHTINNRMAALTHYGGEPPICACCGETITAFLTIDHINGGGNKQRKTFGNHPSRAFYVWLKKNNYPNGFQVLCMNCNWAKGQYGICPHQLNKKK
jgi:hypothetical protein